MTNEQILTKAIEKAIRGGYTDLYCCDTNTPSMLIEDRNVEHCIFSHSFAKAFWGEKPINRLFKAFKWQYHLQQMVLEKEPLKYIEKFL